MERKGINIGTSGWSYKHWRDIFYPPKTKPTDYLAFYAQHFSITEINTSFYRLPAIETVVNWKDKVPPGFCFCPKMSRYLTHMKKLNEPEETLERFFDVFAPLQSLMGPVLIQLPHMVAFNYRVAEALFKILKYQYDAYSFVLEPRHNTWFAEESLTMMAGYNIGLVISQSGTYFPYSEMITATHIYIRFHGPAALYASGYSDDMLSYFAAKFNAWEAEGHTIWAFFNNDIHGYAFKDAARLKALCGV